MATLLDLRVWISRSKPKIWRRLLVDPRLTLEQLHIALQIAFGWTNSHLHQFHDGGTRYTPPPPPGWGPPEPDEVDPRTVRLSEVFTQPKKVIVYEYDFGDSWMHHIRLERIVDSQSVKYPAETFIQTGKGAAPGRPPAAMCIAGDRSGPPEDCGGIYGYMDLLDLLSDPPHPTAKRDQYARERLEWLGEWDPDVVDLTAINQNLGLIRVKRASKTE